MLEYSSISHLTSEILRDLILRHDICAADKEVMASVLVERDSPYAELDGILPIVVRLQDRIAEKAEKNKNQLEMDFAAARMDGRE